MWMKRQVKATAAKIHVQALGMFALIIGLVCFIQSYKRNRFSIDYSTSQRSIQIDLKKVCHSIIWTDLRYCTDTEKSMITFGSPFNLSSNYLMTFGIPLKEFAPIRREDLDDFVFATAANKDYFHIAMDAIGNIQKLLPNHKIYFYDLDSNLTEGNINQINSLCNVTYRKFNFSRYPSHFQHLRTYAFKPLIVHEMLSEFHRVFWVDSSIRFKTNNLTLTLDEVFSSGGILTFEKSIHSNFEATHEEMYRFLPISAQAAANTIQFGANSIYMVRTKEIYTRIIFWWVLCALREDCMAPTRQLHCRFKAKDVYAECHRYDQAALNILMANHFLLNVSRYTSLHDQLEVMRGAAHQELLIVCPTGIKQKSAEYFLQ